MVDEIDKDISKHNLSAYGWDMGVFNHSTPFTSHVIYIRDFRNKQIQLFTISVNDFQQLEVKENIETGECVNFIAQIMKKLSKNKKLNSIEDQALVPILVHYIKNTRSYAHWRTGNSTDERLHMCMNIYYNGKGDPNSVRLRPFIALPPGVMLTVDEFKDCTTTAHDTDRKNHPEWFN